MPPRLSVILPVLNEASRLEAAVARLRRSAPEAEVVVVDGGSSDGTAEAARRVADRFAAAPAPGRAAQMDLGARAASGDVFVFLHADTRLPDGWPETLRRECPSFFGLAGEGPGPLAAAAFRLAFDSDGWRYRLIAFAARCRERLTGVPHGDQALAVPRAVYFAAGGFPETPLMEEYLFVPRLRRLGEVRVLSQSAVTSRRRYEKTGPLRRALKNSCLVLLHYLGVAPRTLARWYLLAAALLAAGPGPGLSDGSLAAHAFDHSHALYAEALGAHVRDGRVDYAALKAAPARLDAYLDGLAAVSAEEFRGWPRAERLAYLLNLYNAQTLRLVLDHHPVKSIKDIGGFLKGPWDQPVVRLFGGKVTLDHLEHEVIRPRYKEPRIHFALVCAAKGCPPLRGTPYDARTLEADLEDQLRRFLEDRDKNRRDAASRTLHLSPIFDWYESDFAENAGSVAAYLAPYFPGSDGFRIRYTRYDWSLNDVR
jgi:rSAM/selenodomain-associated transferase 2